MLGTYEETRAQETCLQSSGFSSFIELIMLTIGYSTMSCPSIYEGLRSESSPTSICAEERGSKNDPTQQRPFRKLPRELRQYILWCAIGYNNDSKEVMKAFIGDPLLYEDVIFVMNKQWTFACSYLCLETSDTNSAWPYTCSYECLRIFEPRSSWNFIQSLSIK